MLNFFTPLSALRGSQVAMSTVANNIANANTPGYHRQSVQFSNLPPREVAGHLLGRGVGVAGIQRAHFEVLERALTANTSELAASQTRLNTLRQVESLFMPGDGSLIDRTQAFFNELERLSSQPGDEVQRRIVVRAADSLAKELQASMGRLANVRAALVDQARQLVDEVNQQSEQIVELNRQIRVARASGFEPNDLLDRRDQLVNELAELVDASLVEQGPNRPVVLLGNGALLIGETPLSLELATDASGQLIIREQGSQDAVTFGGGELAGVLEAANDVVGSYEARLNEFAFELIGAMNGVHATGVGAAGSFSMLRGEQPVSDVTVPLAQAKAQFPIQAGELAVTVTDLSTGERRVTLLAVDPNTQSLQDVAASIGGVDHLQAIADPSSGRLSIFAADGYQFDFTGQLETTPDPAGITGTSTPRLTGRYTGEANEQLTFTVVGSGTVGATDGLSVEVRNAAGDLIGTLDVGSSYAPGTGLTLAGGVSIAFNAGTLNHGDTFSTPLVAHADTAGLLGALGLNRFFAGSSAADIRVDAELLANPARLATGGSSQAGDNENLHRLMALRDLGRMGQGVQTFEGFLFETVGLIGDQVRDEMLVLGSLQAAHQRIASEREAYSGVDPNEEMVNLLRFQRTFQAAARVIMTVDENVQELLRMVR